MAALILWGLPDSPAVRRVAVALEHWRLPYRRRPLAGLGGAAVLARIAPLGRAPVLALADGRILTDARAMIEWLDEEAPPGLRLTPEDPAARLDMIEIESVALGATDLALELAGERLRRAVPDLAQIARHEERIGAALDWLELRGGPGPVAGRSLSRADLALACLATALAMKWPRLWGARRRLIAHRAWAESLPPFLAVPSSGAAAAAGGREEEESGE